jgi:F-type H+-transporting ATPase subunit delta
MPLIESHADAVSRVYAASLFSLADAQGGQPAIESTAAELEHILEAARADARFAEFLSSQILGVGHRRESLRKIFHERISELTLRFLLVLNDKGRLSKLPGIALAFDELLQDRFGRVEVDLWTAVPVDRHQLHALSERLQRVLGREPVVHAYVDESLIGGMRMQIGDQLVDGSVSSGLRRLKEQFASRGAPEIRSRAERLFDDRV